MNSINPLHPTDLGLILSYKCQSACAHYLYNCGPGWVDWMSPQDVRDALERTLIWKQPFQVHITGGEPFLNFSLLQHAVETAASLGIKRYLETNAGWCVNEELVSRQFNDLHTAGLHAILISCSPFHAETIPPKRTLLAIRKAIEIFGSQRVMVYLSQWLDQVTSFGVEESIPLESYIESYGAQIAGSLFWKGYGLISAGRSGYRLGHLIQRRPAGNFKGETCLHEIAYAPHSHFDLYGNYIPGFCGGLSIGSWRDLPKLLEEFSRGNFPELIAILVEAGPFGLFEMSREIYEYEPLEEGYAGKCHLCVDVRRHLVQESSFSELEPKGFYEHF
jgi:hypothetical protein